MAKANALSGSGSLGVGVGGQAYTARTGWPVLDLQVTGIGPCASYTPLTSKMTMRKGKSKRAWGMSSALGDPRVSRTAGEHRRTSQTQGSRGPRASACRFGYSPRRIPRVQTPLRQKWSGGPKPVYRPITTPLPLPLGTPLKLPCEISGVQYAGISAAKLETPPPRRMMP